MKNILIPVDFSDISLNAIEYTEAFFKNTAVNIYLLGVYIGSPSKLMGDDYNEEWFSQMDNNIAKDLNSLVEKFNSRSDVRHKYKAITTADSLIDSIRKVVKEKAINLIISGTKGASGLKEVFIGSHTLKMINHVDGCPILVVPNNYKFNGLTQILFSTNYKRRFNQDELKGLIRMALIHNALIEVVQLISEDFLTDIQKTNKAELKGYLEDFEFDFKKLDWKDSETKTLENHIEDSHSELLAIINHKQNFFSKLTEENVIKKISFHSQIPFLVLPEIEYNKKDRF